MAEKREICEEYAYIGMALISVVPEFEPLKNATIIYLKSNHKKKSHGKKVLGQCEKVQDKNKWAIAADFTITLFEPNIEGLKDTQIAAVIYHELLHAGYTNDMETPWIIPHNIEDFKEVLDRFGTDWNYPGAIPKDEVFLMGILDAAEEYRIQEEPKKRMQKAVREAVAGL